MKSTKLIGVFGIIIAASGSLTAATYWTGDPKDGPLPHIPPGYVALGDFSNGWTAIAPVDQVAIMLGKTEADVFRLLGEEGEGQTYTPNYSHTDAKFNQYTVGETNNPAPAKGTNDTWKQVSGAGGFTNKTDALLESPTDILKRVESFDNSPRLNFLKAPWEQGTDFDFGAYCLRAKGVSRQVYTFPNPTNEFETKTLNLIHSSFVETCTDPYSSPWFQEIQYAVDATGFWDAVTTNYWQFPGGTTFKRFGNVDTISSSASVIQVYQEPLEVQTWKPSSIPFTGAGVLDHLPRQGCCSFCASGGTRPSPGTHSIFWICSHTNLPLQTLWKRDLWGSKDGWWSDASMWTTNLNATNVLMQDIDFDYLGTFAITNDTGVSATFYLKDAEEGTLWQSSSIADNGVTNAPIFEEAYLHVTTTYGSGYDEDPLPASFFGGGVLVQWEDPEYQMTWYNPNPRLAPTNCWFARATNWSSTGSWDRASGVFGCYTVDIPAGEYRLVGQQLILPPGDLTNIWDAVDGDMTVWSYANVGYSAWLPSADCGTNGWSDLNIVTNTALMWGEGVLVKNNSANNPLRLTLRGIVMEDGFTLPLEGNSEKCLITAGIPKAGYLQTDLGWPTALYDTIYLHDGSGYDVYMYDEEGWSPSEPYIRVGEAFFYEKTASTNWIVTCTVP